MRHHLLPILFSFPLLAASCDIKEDTSELTALEGGDLSVIMTTDGEDGPRKGLSHVYLLEGSPPQARVKLFVPGVHCERDNCVEATAVRKDGRMVPLGGVEEGESELVFSLAKLTALPDIVARDDGGPYRILVDVYQKIDGGDRLIKTVGIVYITVLRKGYARLTCDSPNTAYTVKIKKKCDAQFSTKGRSSLCGGGCR